MGKIVSFLYEIGEAFLPELFSLGQIKKIVGTAMAGRASKGGEAKGGEIKWGGLFTLEDEKAFFRIFAKMERTPETANVARNITSFMNGLEETQKRRFRCVVGMLENEGEPAKEEAAAPPTEKKPVKKGEEAAAPPTEKPKEKKPVQHPNYGAEFLIWFSSLSHFDKLDFCKAAGILDGTLDILKRSIVDAINNGKKVAAWLETWATEHQETIDAHLKPTGSTTNPNLGDRAKTLRNWAEKFRDRQ
jgi:hypothetical protein